MNEQETEAVCQDAGCGHLESDHMHTGECMENDESIDMRSGANPKPCPCKGWLPVEDITEEVTL